jgi:hypothetical protein
VRPKRPWRVRLTSEQLGACKRYFAHRDVAMIHAGELAYQSGKVVEIFNVRTKERVTVNRAGQCYGDVR